MDAAIQPMPFPRAESAYSQFAEKLVGATIGAANKAAQSAAQSARSLFAGMEVNSYGVPKPIVNKVDQMTTWMGRTQLCKSITQRTCLEYKKAHTYLSAVILPAIAGALGGAILAGQIGSIVGAVGLGIVGHEKAKTSTMPKFYENEAKKAQKAKEVAAKMTDLIDEFEQQLDPKHHASKLFSTEGKLAYYLQYHKELADETALENLAPDSGSDMPID